MMFVPKVLIGSSRTALVCMPKLPSPWLSTTKCSFRYIEQLVRMPERGGMVSGAASWRTCTLSRKARPASPLTMCSKFSRCSFGIEGIADLVRRQENAAQAVDADRVGQLELVGLDRGPDFAGGELGGGRGVEKPADRGAGAQELFPVGRVGETGVVDEGVGFEHEAVAVDRGRALQQHFDADAGERAALGELELGQVRLEEFELGGIARPEGEGEGDACARPCS